MTASTSLRRAATRPAAGGRVAVSNVGAVWQSRGILRLLVRRDLTVKY